MINLNKRTAFLGCLLAAGSGYSFAETEFSYSGYVKLDAIVSDFSGGEQAAARALGRDFYIPSLTPIDNDLTGSSGGELDMHARQTRFIFNTKTDTANGKTIGTKLELDFIVTADGNERVSNTYVPRMRQAYFTYDKFLFGQAWTTFMHLHALPESVDFIGTTDGIMFNRQPMIRYTHGGLQLALENPETTITPFGGGARIVSDDNGIPDLVAKYTFNGDWGTVSAAMLARQLVCDQTVVVEGEVAFSCDESETSMGITIGGKIKLWAGDDVRFTLNSGSGLGRYAGLNIVNGAVFNEAGELEAIDSQSGSFAYRRVWTSKLRSNAMYSMFKADNDIALTTDAATEKTYSYRINLMYSPVPALTFGAEYTRAKRELENGASGKLDRIQFSAKYGF